MWLKGLNRFAQNYSGEQCVKLYEDPEFKAQCEAAERGEDPRPIAFRGGNAAGASERRHRLGRAHWPSSSWLATDYLPVAILSGPSSFGCYMASKRRDKCLKAR